MVGKLRVKPGPCLNTQNIQVGPRTGQVITGICCCYVTNFLFAGWFYKSRDRDCGGEVTGSVSPLHSPASL